MADQQYRGGDQQYMGGSKRPPPIFIGRSRMGEWAAKDLNKTDLKYFVKAFRLLFRSIYMVKHVADHN